MSRKFLEELGVTPAGEEETIADDVRWGDWSKAQEQYRKEREEYGFDSRQTWNLDISMLELLYERVMLFNTVASSTGDDFEMINVGGVELPFSKVKEEIVTLSEQVLTQVYEGEDAEEFFEEYYGKQRRIWELWAASFYCYGW